jgi:hypothetical protein
MFERKVVIKKQRGGLNIKKQNHLFFLSLPKAVFEHVYISTLVPGWIPETDLENLGPG